MLRKSRNLPAVLSALVITSLVGGCAVHVKEGAEPRTPDGGRLIEEVAEINLPLELDPDGKGCGDSPPCTLEQALKGFYLYQPTTEGANVLEVSNVAAIYAEKQARLLRQLVDEIQLLDPRIRLFVFFR